MINYVYVAIIGIIGGFIAGLLGTTTATTTMFGLLSLDLVPNFKTAAGTTLVSILPPLSLFAAYEYYKKGQVNMTYALILMVFCSLFELVGAKISVLLDDKISKRLLSLYLALVSGYMFYMSY